MGGMGGMVIAGRPPGDVGSALVSRPLSTTACSAASPISSSVIIAVAFEIGSRRKRPA